MFLSSVARAWRGLAVVAIFAVCPAAGALAEVPAAPSGEVVLSIDGPIAQANSGAEAQFDMDMLAAMPSVTFSTTTPWTDGSSSFTGVPLKALLQAVGADGTSVSAIALNNYAVDIPMDSLTDTAPIVAYHIDGKTFSRRDKGPLWIIYPYDSSADYRNELIYGRSIWQLQRLTVN